MINKQDYINSINQNIDMVRGDTLAFNFQLKGLENIKNYEDLIVTFSVAEHYNDTPIIVCSNGKGIVLESYNSINDLATFSVYIAPNKTKTLELTRYYYDLQIKDNNNVVTLMRGRLTLVYDISE